MQQPPGQFDPYEPANRLLPQAQLFRNIQEGTANRQENKEGSKSQSNSADNKVFYLWELFICILAAFAIIAIAITMLVSGIIPLGIVPGIMLASLALGAIVGVYKLKMEGEPLILNKLFPNSPRVAKMINTLKHLVDIVGTLGLIPLIFGAHLFLGFISLPISAPVFIAIFIAIQSIFILSSLFFLANNWIKNKFSKSDAPVPGDQNAQNNQNDPNMSVPNNANQNNQNNQNAQNLSNNRISVGQNEQNDDENDWEDENNDNLDQSSRLEQSQSNESSNRNRV